MILPDGTVMSPRKAR